MKQPYSHDENIKKIILVTEKYEQLGNRLVRFARFFLLAEQEGLFSLIFHCLNIAPILFLKILARSCYFELFVF